MKPDELLGRLRAGLVQISSAQADIERRRGRAVARAREQADTVADRLDPMHAGLVAGRGGLRTYRACADLLDERARLADLLAEHDPDERGG